MADDVSKPHCLAERIQGSAKSRSPGIPISPAGGLAGIFLKIRNYLKYNKIRSKAEQEDLAFYKPCVLLH